MGISPVPFILIFGHLLEPALVEALLVDCTRSISKVSVMWIK